MRQEFIYALLAAGLAAAPAFAASTSDSSGLDQATPSPLSRSQAAPSANQPGAQPGAMRGLQSEADLQKSLQQAGFKDVQVQAQSYVVHAMGPNGSPVVMVVTPDSITGLVANPPQTAQLPTLDQNNDQNDNDQNDGLPGESQDDSGGLRQQD